LQTGEPIWFSEGVYQGQALAGLQPIVSADSIYFADGNGVIVALALSTGTERWRYAYERTLAAGLDPQVCLPVEGQGIGCAPWSIYRINVAASDSSVYLSDMVTARVTALSSADGSEWWSVSTIDRAGGRTQHGALIAHDDGVVVHLLAADASLVDGPSYLGFWDAEDGAEVWSSNLAISSIASDGATLFVSYRRGTETCCFLSGVDARTGRFLWTKQFETEVYVVGYLPAGKTVILQLEYPDTTVGIDVEKREEVWHFRSSQTGCAPQLPFAADGTLACRGPEAGLDLYRPIAPAATPTNAYTIGSYVKVTGDGVPMRSEPWIAPDNIVATYGERELFEIVGGPTADAEGVVWYKVRNLNSELHGYIVADVFAPVTQTGSSDQAVMLGRSPAGDGHYPGPAPTGGTTSCSGQTANAAASSMETASIASTRSAETSTESS
jgi:outer membrane protein assembly factor BamB